MTRQSKDDGSMTTYEDDPMFAEVADILFGGSYEIHKANPDQADLSTNRKKARREKTLATVGVGANAVAIAGGTHALTVAARDKRLAEGGKLSRGTLKAGNWLHNKVKSTKSGAKFDGWATKKKVGGRLAAAGLGLHVAELGADAISHKFLHDAATKKVTDSSKKVHKSCNEFPMSKGKLIRMGSNKAKPVLKKGTLAAKKKLDEVQKVDVRWAGEFSKVDTDKRQVFGWASIVEMDGKPIIDLQGDHISIEEIEKSAYEYVKKSRRGGNMHKSQGMDSDMIESFLVTDDKIEKMGLPESTPRGWWTGFQVNDPELWYLVKEGKRSGFSIHGRGERNTMEN